MAKLWYISKKEYCSDTQKKVLMHAITWLNLKNTVLSERSQTFRIICCMTHFPWQLQNRHKQVHGCQEVGGAGAGAGAGGGVLTRWWKSFKTGAIQQIYITLNTPNTTELCMQTVNFMLCEFHLNFKKKMNGSWHHILKGKTQKQLFLYPTAPSCPSRKLAPHPTAIQTCHFSNKLCSLVLIF